MQTTQLLTTTFETTSPLTETQTAPLENVVESMGEEVHHASRVLNAVLTPIKNAIPFICNFSSHRAFYLECANGFDCGSDCLRRGCRCTGIER